MLAIWNSKVDLLTVQPARLRLRSKGRMEGSGGLAGGGGGGGSVAL